MLLIYLEFFKIGLFAVGGGLATLPFLFQLADKYEWLNREMVGNFIAIAQSAPGPVGPNIAFQAGFQAGGVTGGLLAALGLVSPAIIVITFISKALASIKENKTVSAVFAGLRPAAFGLLAAAGFGALKLALANPVAAWHELIRFKECVIFLILFFLIRKLKGHPVIYIGIGALTGILLGL